MIIEKLMKESKHVVNEELIDIGNCVLSIRKYNDESIDFNLQGHIRHGGISKEDVIAILGDAVTKIDID